MRPIATDTHGFRIGVLVERQRAYGRRLCEGVAAYAGEHPGISLGMLEWSDLNDVRSFSRYDAFIVRVLGDRMQIRLRLGAILLPRVRDCSRHVTRSLAGCVKERRAWQDAKRGPLGFGVWKVLVTRQNVYELPVCNPSKRV